MNATKYEEILKSFDSIEDERPKNFGYETSNNKFELLAKELNNIVKVNWVDNWSSIQDARFYAQLSFLDSNDTTYHLKASNFGNMITIHNFSLLDLKLKEDIRNIIETAGYLFIPEEALKATYNGQIEYLRKHNVDWYERYFQYVL